MTASPSEDDPDDEDDVELPPIHWSWRAAATLLGGGGLTCGTLAVFETDVEAGPVALLVVGLLFAIVAMSGHLPWRIKIGDNEIELQKERKRRRKSDAAAIDTAAAIKPAEQPEAVEVVERVRETNPRLGSAMLSALGYEQMVLDMIARILARRPGIWFAGERVFAEADVTKTPGQQPVQFDALISRVDGTRRALVEIKATTRDVDAGFIHVLHERFIRGVNQYGAEMLLLVTREPLSRAAGMRMAEFTDKRWVQVTGPADEQALEKTIEQLIGKLYWETEPPP